MCGKLLEREILHNFPSNTIHNVTFSETTEDVVTYDLRNFFAICFSSNSLKFLMYRIMDIF